MSVVQGKNDSGCLGASHFDDALFWILPIARQEGGGGSAKRRFKTITKRQRYSRNANNCVQNICLCRRHNKTRARYILWQLCSPVPETRWIVPRSSRVCCVCVSWPTTARENFPHSYMTHAKQNCLTSVSVFPNSSFRPLFLALNKILFWA